MVSLCTYKVVYAKKKNGRGDIREDTNIKGGDTQSDIWLIIYSVTALSIKLYYNILHFIIFYYLLLPFIIYFLLISFIILRKLLLSHTHVKFNNLNPL